MIRILEWKTLRIKNTPTTNPIRDFNVNNDNDDCRLEEPSAVLVHDMSYI
jgi:hypothetical protein